jgi:cytochrome oxidase Cu insertion factor (SCO1/SenC/PrrC family)
MNPERCSLTITKLARVAALISEAGLDNDIAVAAISYDPGFDLPERLRIYGAARGFAFSSNCRLLRTTGSFPEVRDLLGLGVSYGQATVNRHRIELLLLCPDGGLAAYRTRRLWPEGELFEELVRLTGNAKCARPSATASQPPR